MKVIDSVIAVARQKGCSDIHISAGLPLMMRTSGALAPVPEFDMSEEEVKSMLFAMLTEREQKQYEEGGDIDFAYTSDTGYRHRVNIFRQQNKIAATIRLINENIPPLANLGLPEVLNTLADAPRGLILVTGPTGSGKSTTLAAMIDHINSNRAEHIITIEDPIEYVYARKLSLIHQREVGRDVASFAAALRSALREDPDIILVGEMRDYETIAAALTAAETGHLVLSTLHTTGASQTIDRIIDACPASSQNQIRTQLAGVLRGIITQSLIPTKDKPGRVPATEILIGTDAVLNMIRENKCHQLTTSMQSGRAHGMHTLNMDLSELLRRGRISRENALKYTNDSKDLSQFID